MKITQERLKELLTYDENTGMFTWAIDRNNRRKKGDIAGCYTKRGYLTIVADGKNYTAHQLAWLYTYGEYPTYQIDHINGTKDDNRICNLRDVKQSVNCKNQRKPKRNTSGVIGVYWHKRDKRWTASIKVDGKYINGGSYLEFSDAVNARKNLEVQYGFHANHGREK